MLTSAPTPTSRSPLQPIEPNRPRPHQQHQQNIWSRKPTPPPIDDTHALPPHPTPVKPAQQPQAATPLEEGSDASSSVSEQPANKWQRIGTSGGGGSQRVAVSVAPPLPPLSPVTAPVYDYHGEVARLKAELAAAAQERVSLIPDIPGVDMQPNMAPTARTAWDMLQDETPCLSLGDPLLDRPLRGGLGEGITELVGEAACGKTQLAMQLLLQCQLPRSSGGLGGGSLFLSMEGDFPIQRLHALADSFKREHPTVNHDMLGKIFIKPIASPSELSFVLRTQVRSSLESGQVKLIVLDSIAAVFRTDQQHQQTTSTTTNSSNSNAREMDFSERSQDLLRLAAQLKQYSSTYHVPVVVINQVTDFFAGADANNGQALRVEEVKHSFQHHWSRLSSGHRVLPALGLTWANCVNTRIFLTRKHEFATVDLPSSQRTAASLPPSQQYPSSSSSVDAPGGLTPLVNMFTPSGANSTRGTANTASYTLAASVRPPLSQSGSSSFPLTPPPVITRRFLHVAFAPHLPQATAEFVIETGGVRGIAGINQPTHHQAIHLSPTIASDNPPAEAAPSIWTPHSSLVSSSSHMFGSSFGISSWPAASSSSAGSSESVFRNMFTPSGGGHQGSYFDDDSDAPGQADEEALALAQAEANMTRGGGPQQRQPHPAPHPPVRFTSTGVPVLSPTALVSSPSVAPTASVASPHPPSAAHPQQAQSSPATPRSSSVWPPPAPSSAPRASPPQQRFVGYRPQ